MFFKKKGLPGMNEFVLCTVKRVLPHCAFVKLEEYDDREAMLHISEVSSKFVKNIKEHLTIGTQMVCKVLGLHKDKGHIDVSLKRVSNVEKKRKMDDIKTQVRLEKLIEIIAKTNKKDTKKALVDVGGKIISNFGSFPEFYSAVRNESVNVIDELEIDEDIARDLKSRLLEQIKAQRVKMKRVVEVFSNESDGLVRLKSLFKKVTDLAEHENIDIVIRYISAPVYEIEIVIKDYKQGEAFFKQVHETMEEYSGKNMIELKSFKE